MYVIIISSSNWIYCPRKWKIHPTASPAKLILCLHKTRSLAGEAVRLTFHLNLTCTGSWRFLVGNNILFYIILTDGPGRTRKKRPSGVWKQEPRGGKFIINGSNESNTRIIIYTGHRENSLVLAGHYFLKKNLVMAIKSEPHDNTAFDCLLPHCKFRGQVAVLHTQTL